MSALPGSAARRSQRTAVPPPRAANVRTGPQPAPGRQVAERTELAFAQTATASPAWSPPRVKATSTASVAWTASKLVGKERTVFSPHAFVSPSQIAPWTAKASAPAPNSFATPTKAIRFVPGIGARRTQSKTAATCVLPCGVIV